jgi:chemotaxis regulatin CheY-phosphate phosphatase CheZ
VAKLIISGQVQELSTTLKGEVGDLLRLLVNIKAKVDDIAPNIIKSHDEMPNMSNALNDVNVKTEKAAHNVLEHAQKLNNFYKELYSSTERIASALSGKDMDSYESAKKELALKIDKASDLGLYVLEALEFQDITEQKLRKVIQSLDDVAARIGAIVGFIRAKDSEHRESYDALLTDLGFA